VTDTEFIPADFVPPRGITAPGMVLEPLGPQHNERDHAAWSSSMEHIRATPGFPDGRWPREMSLAENRSDLERHERDFAGRRGFTYTVRDPGDGDVIGCVYIYPLKGADAGVAEVSSWVRADRAELDVPLHRAVTEWLERDWPFPRFEYAPRPQ
jgi:RimJ/RimL family protein N-acetyltransferase